ncbi:MAG: hypothetical protein GVY24_02000 [Planctomycetes bacterium]|jgi:ankyrin repeat protein|nr:hypothetical protein [Planctomycetota bacterium]
MPDSSYRDRITDPAFRRAVDLLDAGDTDELRQLLAAHPSLVTQHVTFEGPSGGGYFTWPTLLHFVAENPIRHGTLPGNIIEIVDALIEAGADVHASSHKQRHETTLALVASGCAARECGVQSALLERLVAHGADPGQGLHAALAHGELDAARTLVRLGAPIDLVAAACLGDHEKLSNLLASADDAAKRRALALAALTGQKRSVEILLDRGVDPNRYNPDGAHAHATPLHNAVSGGHVETVVALVTRGANRHLRDKLWDGDAFGWAQHIDKTDVLDALRQLDQFMPGIEAIRAGDLAGLDAWLDDHPELVNAMLPGQGRTPLHYATDWPGKRPNVGAVIRKLIAAGADPNARAQGMHHQETPLHWAASCDDVEAIEALIEGGADVNLLGGVIDGGTPLDNAVAFKQPQAETCLRALGARTGADFEGHGGDA